jgi:hypothetical protein
VCVASTLGASFLHRSRASERRARVDPHELIATAPQASGKRVHFEGLWRPSRLRHRNPLFVVVRDQT